MFWLVEGIYTTIPLHQKCSPIPTVAGKPDTNLNGTQSRRARPRDPRSLARQLPTRRVIISGAFSGIFSWYPIC